MSNFRSAKVPSFEILARIVTSFLVVASFTLAGCATGPRTSYHTFSFDGRYDKWATEVDLLEFDYGGKHGMTRKSVGPGETTLGGVGVNATMPNGEYLYVKWRLKSTGEVLEDRVDLRNLLPSDMSDNTVTFVIDHRQLFVYLVTPQITPRTEPPPRKTYLSRFHVSYELYPNNVSKR